MFHNHHIAVYYFPGYHSDPRNDKFHGKGWTEWELVKRATPRFAGHDQPKKPLWGCEDESDPRVMARKIDTATAYGIDAFIFDWYWHSEGAYLNAGLDCGFLRAPNSDRIKFALMWANHNWVNIHPASRSAKPGTAYEGRVSPEVFIEATDYAIRTYFSHPSYWKVDGKLYFSFYEISKLLKNFGSVGATKAGLEHFRERVRSSGLGELHLNAVVWGTATLPGEEKIENIDSVLDDLGFDSVTSYVWIHHREPESFPFTDYATYRQQCQGDWEKFHEERTLPYYPNVTMGWDPSPRTIQSDAYDYLGYPFTPILVNNTPEQFELALRSAGSFLDSRYPNGGFFTINAWNEWTEGSYLEPDEHAGFAYLEAIQRASGT